MLDAASTTGEDLTRCLEARLPSFYHVALGMLGNPAEAEDAVQDNALRAIRSLHTFRSESDMCTWIHRILINRCNDQLTSNHRQVEELSDESVEALWQDPTYTVDPARVVESLQDRERVSSALARLSAPQRLVVVMHDSHGWKLQEIADLLEMPLATTKSHLRRGRQGLVTLLGREDPHNAP